MIEIVTANGKKIAKISDNASDDDIVYVDGKPMKLNDVYNNPDIFQKFNDEIKGSVNGIKLQD